MSTPKPKLGAEPAPASEPKSEPGAEPERKPDPKRKSDPERKPEPGAEPERKPDPKRKRWGLRIGLAVGCLVIAAALVFVGFAAGSRWLRYNDAHDIEGTWYVDGTDVPIAFADGEIVFDSDTAYAYTIDPQAKTIAYSLGDLQGEGRYWFSDDRGTLVLTDGGDYTMWSTLFDDLAYDLSRLFGNGELPTDEGSIVLTHVITLPGKSDSSGQGGSSSGQGGGSGGQDGSSDGQAGDAAGQPDGSPGDSAADEGAGSRPGGKDDFSDLSISDVLMKDDGSGDGGEQEEAW